MKRRTVMGAVEAAVVVGLAAMIGLAGCSAPEGAEAQAEKGTGTGRPAVAVEAAKVVTGNLTEAIDVVGSLAPKFEVEVKSEYTGIATEVYVNEWVRVKKGDPLAKLDIREANLVVQKARSAVESAKANLMQGEVAANRADREYERLQKLKESGLVTQQNLDDGRTAKEASAAGIAAARAGLAAAEEDVRHAETRLSKAVIRAPIDGVVASRGVNVGDLVGEMGSPKVMFRIVDNRLLNLTVSVPSKQMESIQIGQRLAFSTDALPGKTFEGTVMFINPALDAADRSVKVIAEVPNEAGELRGGMFVKGRIVTGERTGILQVPRSAFLSWSLADRKGDLFLVEKEIARRREVRTGEASSDWIEVTAGLVEGDWVVTRGGFNVRDGDTVTVQAATKSNGG